MAIRVYLKSFITLDDTWVDEKTYKERFANNIELLRKLLDEDLGSVFDAGGGAEIFQSSEWVVD